MFHCDFCHTTTEPHEKLVLITTAKREKFYPAKHRGESPGYGWEIAEQKKACPACAAVERDVERVVRVPKSGEWQEVA